MAKKLSDRAIEILLMVESSYVRVSWYDSMRPVGMTTSAPGHGTKSNPPGRSILKLIDDGLIEGREHADLTLTKEGREAAIEAHQDGWELETGVGHKPRAVRKAATT